MLQCRLPAMSVTFRHSTRIPRHIRAQANRKVLPHHRFISSSSPATKLPPSSKPAYDPNKAPYKIPLPGPRWLWTPLKPFSYPLAAYNRVSSNRPYGTQFVSSLIIFFLGDLMSQYIQRPIPVSSPSEAIEGSQPAASASTCASAPAKTLWSTYDPQRSVRALIIGGVVSIPMYHWFMYLAKLWPTLPHTRSLAWKVGLNSTVFAPVLNTYFFTMQSLLAGHGGNTIQGKAEAAWVRTRDTLPRSWLNGLMYWPAVTAFSFTFVAPKSRAIFNGVAAIGWQTYLGLLNHRASMRELGNRESAAIKIGS